VVIGRDPECGVIIKSSAVSQASRVIAPGLLGYMITDESTNGVFVNGARIEGAHAAASGRRVRIGKTGFRFEADEAVFEPRRDASRGTDACRAPSSTCRSR